MSVCFCNETGFMLGNDLHDYYAAPGNVKVPCTPHLVWVPFFRPVWRVKNHADVTMDKWQSFEQGADFYLVTHSPLAPALGLMPDSMEIQEIVNIFIGSGAKLWMGVHGVTIGGGWAATCLNGSSGTTMNCNDPLDLPTGQFTIFNSVVTQPTPGDYAGSYRAAALDAVAGMVIGHALKARNLRNATEIAIKHGLRRLDQAKELPVNDEAKKGLEWIDTPGKGADYVKQQTQQAVDGALQGSR